MKAIKITEENAAKITAALAEVNGLSAAHAFTCYEEIAFLAAQGDRELTGLLPKTSRPGAKVWALSGAPVAKSYRNRRHGTWAGLEYRRSGWWLVAVRQVDLFPNQGGKVDLVLTPEQDRAAIERFRKGYRVVAGAVQEPAKIGSETA